jgi:hypothetical protein
VQPLLLGGPRHVLAGENDLLADRKGLSENNRDYETSLENRTFQELPLSQMPGKYIGRDESRRDNKMFRSLGVTRQ